MKKSLTFPEMQIILHKNNPHVMKKVIDTLELDDDIEIHEFYHVLIDIKFVFNVSLETLNQEMNRIVGNSTCCSFNIYSFNEKSECPIITVKSTEKNVGCHKAEMIRIWLKNHNCEYGSPESIKHIEHTGLHTYNADIFIDIHECDEPSILKGCVDNYDMYGVKAWLEIETGNTVARIITFTENYDSCCRSTVDLIRTARSFGCELVEVKTDV